MAANPPPPVEVWSCNWESFQIFCAMSSQWRMGPVAPVGLDYSVLPLVAEQIGIPLSRQRFDDLQVMERETLRALAERKS